MKKESGSAFFAQRSPRDVERFVEMNFDISEQVSHWMAQRGWTCNDLAKALGKRPSVIARWLSGTHNMTLRSIARMEAALGEDILLTPLKASKCRPELTVAICHSTVFHQDIPVANYPDTNLSYSDNAPVHHQVRVC